MLKYRIFTSWNDARITAVEVLRETDQSVFVKADHKVCGERREAKYSDHSAYFDTWEAARDELLVIASKEVNRTRNALERAKSFEGNVKGLKPPIDSARESLSPSRSEIEMKLVS